MTTEDEAGSTRQVNGASPRPSHNPDASSNGPSPPRQTGTGGTTITDAERQAFEYWVECEKVAMHFNEVTLNFRLKALGLLAVGAGLLGGLFGKKDTPPTASDWHILSAVILLTLTVWCGLALLDVRYYIPLLSGAVDEIKRVEREHPQLQLSTRIERSVKRAGFNGGRNRPRRLVTLMYALPGGCLAVFLLLALKKAGVLAVLCQWACKP